MTKEAKRKTIADLKKYPDWIVRIECEGLGGEPVTIGGCWEDNFINSEYRHSIIENYLEYEEEIVKKVFAIERVFERIKGIRKNIIRLRYLLPDNSVESICQQLDIPKSTYFYLHNDTIVNFATALGHIK